MRHFKLVILMLCALPVCAQSYPEVDALLGLVFAQDGKTFVQYLPAELEQELEALPVQDQRVLELKFQEARRGFMEDMIVERAESSDVLLKIQQRRGDSVDQLEVRLSKRISDGQDALLLLQIARNGSEQGNSTMAASMRFEEGQWRLVGVSKFYSDDLVDLESPAVLATFRGGRYFPTERKAEEQLYTYHDAITTYRALHPQEGMPSGLDTTGAERPCTEENVGPCGEDPVLFKPPFESSGYRFRYSRSGDEFELIARPIQYGRTGRRSFRIDQERRVRWTEEDRDPTADDPTLSFR